MHVSTRTPIALALAGSLLGAGPVLAGDVRLDGFPEFDAQLDKVLPDFKAEEPDVAVTYQMNDYGDHHKRLTTQLATGEGAGDVVVVDIGFVGSFINSGGFENLSAAPYDADSVAGDYVSYAWNQGKGTDGNQYAIPVDIGPGVMYYRRDVLDKAGADIDDVIASWDGYVEYGRTLKAEGGYLIADAADVAKTIIVTTVKEGDGFYFDADGESLITSERFVRAFTLARQIRDEGLDAQIASWTNEWFDAFKTGTVATQLSGAWLLGQLQSWMAPDTAGLWGVSDLPDGVYGSWGGAFLAIPKQAKNKADAWKLVRFLTGNPDIQLDGLRNIGAFPVLTSVYDDPMFDEEIPFLDGQKGRQLFADVAGKVPAVAPRDGDLIADDVVLGGALAEVLEDGKDIEAALRDAERLVKRRVR